jgi:murein DD-endopeptidase MepM/ murein hydrolase activator NlpD
MKRLIYIIFVGLTINCFGNNPTVYKLDTIGIANKSKRIVYQTAEIEKYKSLLKADFINIESKDTVTSWNLPFALSDRSDLKKVKIISSFGVYRKSNYKGHKHSGIDIVPLLKDKNIHVYPVANGVVCYIRIDPPFSTVVIKHKLKNNCFIYSSYIHLKDVYAQKGQQVDQNTDIGKLFTYEEAWKYNGPYDHLHLEIRKSFDDYGCATYLCMTLQKLKEIFCDPFIFLKDSL